MKFFALFIFLVAANTYACNDFEQNCKLDAPHLDEILRVVDESGTVPTEGKRILNEALLKVDELKREIQENGCLVQADRSPICGDARPE